LAASATHLDPTDLLAFNNLGVGHLAMHDWRAAEDAFTQVIALQPDRPGGYRGRAQARAGHGDFEGARRDTETAERLERAAAGEAGRASDADPGRPDSSRP
jgi:regulator of sirC expression with transglutaminase-like and TPR domain